MGDINQHHFVQQHIDQFQGPFLEIGSRDYGSTQDMRSLFPGQTYVGIDMSEGKSVDHVLDLTLDMPAVDAVLGGQRFGTIFCLSVMEHCDNPFKMAENITALLQPGGKLYLSVPFAWKFHGYPSDYWRFTHEGVKKLFPDLVWESGDDMLSTPRDQDIYPLDEDIGKLTLSGKAWRRKGCWGKGLAVDLLGLMPRLGLLRWLLGYRYLMMPSMINMIGSRPETNDD